jgi:hypothetical protein
LVDHSFTNQYYYYYEYHYYHCYFNNNYCYYYYYSNSIIKQACNQFAKNQYRAGIDIDAPAAPLGDEVDAEVEDVRIINWFDTLLHYHPIARLPILTPYDRFTCAWKFCAELQSLALAIIYSHSLMTQVVHLLIIPSQGDGLEDEDDFGEGANLDSMILI